MAIGTEAKEHAEHAVARAEEQEVVAGHAATMQTRGEAEQCKGSNCGLAIAGDLA